MLVVVVIVTPAYLAMSVAIDPVAVLVSISPLIVIVKPRTAGDNATRYAHEGSERTQYSYPIKCIH